MANITQEMMYITGCDRTCTINTVPFILWLPCYKQKIAQEDSLQFYSLKVKMILTVILLTVVLHNQTHIL